MRSPVSRQIARGHEPCRPPRALSRRRAPRSTPCQRDAAPARRLPWRRPIRPGRTDPVVRLPHRDRGSRGVGRATVAGAAGATSDGGPDAFGAAALFVSVPPPPLPCPRGLSFLAVAVAPTSTGAVGSPIPLGGPAGGAAGASVSPGAARAPSRPRCRPPPRRPRRDPRLAGRDRFSSPGTVGFVDGDMPRSLDASASAAGGVVRAPRRRRPSP